MPNSSRTWLAVEGGRQVGSLVAYPFDSRRREGGRWGIHSFEVIPEAQSGGLGGRLLSATLERLGGWGVEEVETLVLPEEAPAALHLYRKFGFQKVAEWGVWT